MFAIKVSIFDIFDEDWIYEMHEKDLVRKSEARGEAKATRSLARSMFEEGLSDEMVARLIKQPVSEVRALKAELEQEEPAS